MAYRSPFSSAGQPYTPPSRETPEMSRLDWRGLDLAMPHDAMRDNRSPFAKNFRIYADEADDRRVTISSRKGSGDYLDWVGETEEATFETTTGAADATVGISTEWKAMPFDAEDDGPLSMVELNLKKDSDSAGPVIVEIREDSNGAPGNLLATSSILNSDIGESYGYVACRFIEAPDLTNTETYWITAHVQDDGEGVYYWSSSTAGTDALTSDTGGLGWTATSYSLNFKTYQSDESVVKGLSRYAPHGGDNETLIAIGTSIYSASAADGTLTEIVSSLNSNADYTTFTYADDKAFISNGFDDLTVWDGSADSTITHANLPTPKFATFHKNRLFVVDADDPNKIVYSEDPGNEDGSGNFWYEGYLSTSFIYVPAPTASDPITALVPFQDSLVIFTTTDKYILYGSDPGSFVVRQATGRKGAVSHRGVVADENFIYFVSDDGFYRYNGAADQRISGPIQPEFNNIADLGKVSAVKSKNRVRFYYPQSGSSVNNACLLYNELLEEDGFGEWEMDTDSYVSFAVQWRDGDDEKLLVEASSKAPTAFFAEQHDHNLGKPIDFEYRCKYDSMGNPAKRKRIKRLYGLLEAEGGDYPITIGVDRDLNNSARETQVSLTTSGLLVGHQLVGDGSTVGGGSEYEPRRVRVSGNGYYWQVRVKRVGVDTPVNFLGYVLSYREKRL